MRAKIATTPGEQGNIPGVNGYGECWTKTSNHIVTRPRRNRKESPKHHQEKENKGKKQCETIIATGCVQSKPKKSSLLFALLTASLSVTILHQIHQSTAIFYRCLFSRFPPELLAAESSDWEVALSTPKELWFACHASSLLNRIRSLSERLGGEVKGRCELNPALANFDNRSNEHPGYSSGSKHPSGGSYSPGAVHCENLFTFDSQEQKFIKGDLFFYYAALLRSLLFELQQLSFFHYTGLSMAKINLAIRFDPNRVKYPMGCVSVTQGGPSWQLLDETEKHIVGGPHWASCFSRQGFPLRNGGSCCVLLSVGKQSGYTVSSDNFLPAPLEWKNQTGIQGIFSALCSYKLNHTIESHKAATNITQGRGEKMRGQSVDIYSSCMLSLDDKLHSYPLLKKKDLFIYCGVSGAQEALESLAEELKLCQFSDQILTCPQPVHRAVTLNDCSAHFSACLMLSLKLCQQERVFNILFCGEDEKEENNRSGHSNNQASSFLQEELKDLVLNIVRTDLIRGETQAAPLHLLISVSVMARVPANVPLKSHVKKLDLSGVERALLTGSSLSQVLGRRVGNPFKDLSKPQLDTSALHFSVLNKMRNHRIIKYTCSIYLQVKASQNQSMSPKWKAVLPWHTAKLYFSITREDKKRERERKSSESLEGLLGKVKVPGWRCDSITSGRLFSVTGDASVASSELAVGNLYRSGSPCLACDCSESLLPGYLEQAALLNMTGRTSMGAYGVLVLHREDFHERIRGSASFSGEDIHGRIWGSVSFLRGGLPWVHTNSRARPLETAAREISFNCKEVHLITSVLKVSPFMISGPQVLMQFSVMQKAAVVNTIPSFLSALPVLPLLSDTKAVSRMMQRRYFQIPIQVKKLLGILDEHTLAFATYSDTSANCFGHILVQFFFGGAVAKLRLEPLQRAYEILIQLSVHLDFLQKVKQLFQAETVPQGSHFRKSQECRGNIKEIEQLMLLRMCYQQKLCCQQFLPQTTQVFLEGGYDDKDISNMFTKSFDFPLILFFLKNIPSKQVSMNFNLMVNQFPVMYENNCSLDTILFTDQDSLVVISKMENFCKRGMQRLLGTGGGGISPSWLHQHVAQLLLLPLGAYVRAYPLLDELDELERVLVLGHLEQLHGALLVGREAAHLPDHVPQELGVLCEAPAPPAVPRLPHVLRHLVALVEAHGHGVAQGHGCSSPM
ncbi:hypothetical protein U0070_014303, partial [Myodes glareolus]